MKALSVLLTLALLLAADQLAANLARAKALPAHHTPPAAGRETNTVSFARTHGQPFDASNATD